MAFKIFNVRVGKPYKASADAMSDAEFTHYQFMATLDRRTCARCGERDGEIFAIADMNQGENAPPLHPRCRCTIVATFDTPKSRSKPVGERSARETGDRRERAPADMTYRDWKAIYIDKSKTFADWRSAKDAKYRADSLTSTVARGNVGKEKETIIRAKLEETMAELKLKGTLVYPPPKIDFSSFRFDAEHTQGDKHPHGVTEIEARQFIEAAYFLIKRYNGNRACW